MHIAMAVPGMPFNGATIPDGESLGGSESAGYYMARELVKRGHRVIVFTNSEKSGTWDGVTYEFLGTPREGAPMGERFHYVMHAPYDVVVAQRHPYAFRNIYNSKLNVWWLHDLALHRFSMQAQEQLMNIDKVFTVSEFHKRQVSEVYGIPEGFISATKNGIAYEEYEGLEIFEREPNSLVYASRPERGLDNLVGKDGIMEMLPDCHLYVCGYDNTVPQMRQYYEYLWGRCNELKNVTNLGALGKRQLAELMSRCMLYVYPTTFEDTSCMVALEANACGTPFIAFKTGALPETMHEAGAILLDLDEKGQVDKKLFAKTVKTALHKWTGLHKKAKAKRQTWPEIAAQWEQTFEDMLRERSANKMRLHKHLEMQSDIVAGVKDGMEKTRPDIKKNYYFYFSGDYEDHYKRYYINEQKKGVEYGPEELGPVTRFIQIFRRIEELKPKSVLDFGCAHGHYTMNLALRMPDTKFLGLDFMQSNIDKARAWAEQKNASDRVQFKCGHLEKMHKELGKFDLIIASEIFEHVPNVQEISDILLEHLEPNGHMLITVPSGPWEAIGYYDKENLGWRAHIHHFERQDLYELWGNQREYKLIAIPSLYVWRGYVGHWLLTFQRSGLPTGQINYERKLKQQAPRETLSVCMIAKDAEYTLGKTLKSVKMIADEIIIGIDETTTDETERVAKAFGAQTFKITSPLEQGFDEARNRTIEKATMDWILWIDSDETLENWMNLPQHLRPNCYNGYSVRQHHYAVEPAALFKTDLPARIFRNHKGIKFYGCVHEHPEEEMNKGISKICVLNDIAIMHTGYSTERIRRERFKRNWPLMQKDRIKYPERRLGCFLWMRDLIHQTKYTLESNGGQFTDELRGYAREAITIWRDLLEKNELRMVIDGMQYYTEAVRLLNNGNGIRFSYLDLASNLTPHIDENKRAQLNSGLMSALEFQGRIAENLFDGVFENKEDIKRLTQRLIEAKTGVYEEKYF